MRHYITLFTLLIAAYLASSSPIHELRLVKRPYVKDVFGARPRRSEQFIKTKGGKDPSIRVEQPIELRVRKGEYVCGNKLCKLQPGVKPDCPDCQYAIAKK